MLKIFHNNFFENLSDPIPPFFTTKKFGLLMSMVVLVQGRQAGGIEKCFSAHHMQRSYSTSTTSQLFSHQHILQGLNCFQRAMIVTALSTNDDDLEVFNQVRGIIRAVIIFNMHNLAIYVEERLKLWKKKKSGCWNSLFSRDYPPLLLVESPPFSTTKIQGSASLYDSSSLCVLCTMWLIH